jgi:hypothetical protein
LRHVDNGIKILPELKNTQLGSSSSSNNEKKSYAPTRALAQVFTTLDMKATQMMLFRAHLSSEFRDHDLDFLLPTSFRTIKEAK